MTLLAKEQAMPRRRRRWNVWVIGAWVVGGGGILVVGGGLTVAFSGEALAAVARNRLEARVGPLIRERFAPPAVDPSSNPGPALLAACDLVRLEEAERAFLKDCVHQGRSAIVRHRPRLEALAARNREVLERMRRLQPGKSSLERNVFADEAYPDNLREQFQIARLLYIEGVLALADQDVPASAGVAKVLGRQAEILQAEPHIVVQLVGLYVEKLQLHLLIALADEAPPGFGVESLARTLIANDPRQRLRDALALEALILEQEIGSGKAPSQREGGTVGRALGHSVLGYSMAGAFDWHRTCYQAYDDGYREGRDKLKIRDADEMSFPEKIRWLLAPNFLDMAGRYRAMAESRALTGACLRARSLAAAGLGCEEVGKRLAGAGPFPLEIVATDPGRCTLRSPDREEYEEIFEQTPAVPSPLECTIGRGLS